MAQKNLNIKTKPQTYISNIFGLVLLIRYSMNVQNRVLTSKYT